MFFLKEAQVSHEPARSFAPHLSSATFMVTKPAVDVFLLVSGELEDTALLADKVLLRRILREIPILLGMNAISSPIVLKATNNPGLEGYVPIDTSNVTISTYIEPPRIVVCIHSCRAFNEAAALEFLRISFQCSNLRHSFITSDQIGVL